MERLGFTIGVVIALVVVRMVRPQTFSGGKLPVILVLLAAAIGGSSLVLGKQQVRQFERSFDAGCHTECEKRLSPGACTRYCECALAAVYDGRKPKEVVSIWTASGGQVSGLPEDERARVEGIPALCEGH